MIKKIDELTLEVLNNVEINLDFDLYEQSKFNYDYLKYYNDVRS
jgi:hypothetical protein